MYRVIVLPDIHLPFEDKIALSAVEEYMADTRFDEWLCLGDLMDFDYISRWTADNLKVITGTTFLDDYNNANAFLDRHQKIIRKRNPQAKFTLIEGNHDVRPAKVIEKDPRFEGLIEFHRNLRLYERGIKFVPYFSKGEVYTVGNASFIHGNYTNQYHAQKHVSRYGRSVFYGHLHDIQSFTLVWQGEKTKQIIGQSMGCLCRLDMNYMGGKPHNWIHGFGLFEFRPSGDFTYQVVSIINGQFTINGKTYAGRP